MIKKFNGEILNLNQKIEKLEEELRKIDESYLDVIKPALEKKKKVNSPVIAMKIGRKIITGK